MDLFAIIGRLFIRFSFRKWIQECEYLLFNGPKKVLQIIPYWIDFQKCTISNGPHLSTLNGCIEYIL